MTTEPGDPSMSSQDQNMKVLLRPRFELFEHGLLPIPKLIFADPVQDLSAFKQKLAASHQRVDSPTLADLLDIPLDHARLVLDTLASVLPSDSDAAVSFGADLRHLILFLYIQSHKRLSPRSHRDAASVADVWPGTSAFDNHMKALSPVQLVRSNSRRFMPSQADEEAHQLSFLQRNLENILSLLGDHVEGEGEESPVLSKEGLEHLGFLVQFFSERSESIPLRKATSFFENSNPDMPALPIPAVQVLDWFEKKIASALEHVTQSTSSNGPQSCSNPDVSMIDASGSPRNAFSNVHGPCFIEGISESSYVMQASDLKSSSVKVVNCHESAIYILAPVRYVTIYGCSDATIVLGAAGKAVRVEHCERVCVITAVKRVCIANCRECVFYLGVNHRPLIIGENHKLQVAPYNTFYSQLGKHIKEVGIDPTINKWNEPLALEAVDPHDSSSHPPGASDVQAESATCIDPDQFMKFLIPDWIDGESGGSIKDNPFVLPDVYLASQQRNQKNMIEVKQMLRELPLEEKRKREVSFALHVYFREWLYASGSIRQLYCVQPE